MRTILNVLDAIFNQVLGRIVIFHVKYALYFIVPIHLRSIINRSEARAFLSSFFIALFLATTHIGFVKCWVGLSIGHECALRRTLLGDKVTESVECNLGSDQ